ncbi:MAG: phosphate ABC transporter, permease protein PstA, partial [Bacteroidetes bacterium]|nr:phosphate ABC transporter, permease protein PstA [Bacteroidota bacterium]
MDDMPAYSLRTRIAEGRDHRVVKDKLLSILVIVFSAITIFPIVLIIGKLISKGYKQINLDFFIKKAPDTYEAMTALNAGEIIPGGILNGITGT